MHRIIFGTCARSGIDDNDIIFIQSFQNTVLDCFPVVYDDVITCRDAAVFTNDCLEHSGVGFNDVSLFGVITRLDDFGPGRNDSDTGLGKYRNLRYAAGKQNTYVDRPNFVIAGQDHLAANNIFPDRSDVLPGVGRRMNDNSVFRLLNIFSHDDGIVWLFNRIAGIDNDIVFFRLQKNGR